MKATFNFKENRLAASQFVGREVQTRHGLLTLEEVEENATSFTGSFYNEEEMEYESYPFTSFEVEVEESFDPYEFLLTKEESETFSFMVL